MVTARITALSPGASPPPVLMAMRRMRVRTAPEVVFLLAEAVLRAMKVSLELVKTDNTSNLTAPALEHNPSGRPPPPTACFLSFGPVLD